MRITGRAAIFFILAVAMAFVFQLNGREAQAQSSYFTSQGCSGCHSAPVAASCNGCHAHGTHPSSAKSSINVAGATNKASYAPGETVTVTITGGYRTGWFRAVLYNQNSIELARSTGNDSGMGSSTTYPATLSAPAPTTPGTYTWKAAWYGNKYDASGAAFGAGWTPDPTNPNHGYEIVNTNSFTVAAAGDTAAPVITVFTLPSSAASLTVPVSAFTATDNTGVTGYLITTSTTPPAASAAGWSATAPTSVTAPASGSTTFHAWAKDAAGNVSAGVTASITITLPDTAAPVVNSFTLPASATSLTVPVSSFTATDNTGVTGYLITTSVTPPAASATGWSATAPKNAVAPADGSVTFYAWAKDAAGNVSAAKSASVAVSTTIASLALTVSTVADGSTTNNPTLNVSGTATDPVGIKSVTVNGQAATVNAAGSFSTVVTLQSGANTITVIAIDNSGIQKTDTRTVTYDMTAPLITVLAPADNSMTTQPLATVTGTISESSTVSVNVNDGNPQAAAINGNSCTATVNLVSGVNTITITATDMAGNTSSIKRTVTYTVDTNTTLDLAVTNPIQDITSSDNVLNLRGNVVDPQGQVTVAVTMNGKTYKPEVDDGRFQQRLMFTSAGQYIITVSARDQAGNSSSVVRNVVYRPLNSNRQHHHDD
jgi:Glucodextranase, domain B